MDHTLVWAEMMQLMSIWQGNDMIYENKWLIYENKNNCRNSKYRSCRIGNIQLYGIYMKTKTIAGILSIAAAGLMPKLFAVALPLVITIGGCGAAVFGKKESTVKGIVLAVVGIGIMIVTILFNR